MWQIKNVICPLSKGLWTPNLAGCWLRWGNPTHKSSGTSNTWSRDKSKMLYVPLSQGLWIPNLANWWLRMKGTHPQSHVTHWSSAHVANQEDFTFTLTWRKAHKLSKKGHFHQTFSVIIFRHDVSTTGYSLSIFHLLESHIAQFHIGFKK